MKGDESSMKKTVTMLLLLSMLLSLASCSGSEKETETTGADKTTDMSAQMESETEPETADPLAGLDVVDMEGYTFRQLIRNNDRWVADMIAEEQTGEVVNDAVFRRNTEVEERYNCKFTYQRSSNDNSDMDAKPGIIAGDDAYDWIIGHPRAVAQYADEGLALDWNTLKYIDLTRSWWDQDAVENFQMPGGIFWMTGDISYESLGAAVCMLFNKDYFDENQLAYPYQTVKDGKWTFDEFLGMAQDYSRDLDGDGVIGEDDIYGYVSFRWIGPIQAFICSGSRVVKSAAEGYAFDVFNERSLAMFEKYFPLVQSENTFIDITSTSGGTNREMFRDGNALFVDMNISDVSVLREMESQFGILPWPKYDEQSEYLTNVDAGTNMFFVPITNRVTDNTSLVLESMAILGREYIIPAYYDIALKTRDSRDEDSAPMLDIIMENRVFDLGYYSTGLGGAYSSHFADLVKLTSPDFASWYDAKLKSATTARDKLLAAYEERAAAIK